ncbi:MAG: trypsin-like serine protease [Myxococcota bacterium]
MSLALVLALGSSSELSVPEHGVAAVVPRRGTVDEASSQVLCTAALVSDRALLTAGHCVDDEARGTLELAFGPDPADPDEVRLIREIVLHPRYSTTDSAFDLAVLWLDEPVTRAPIPRHEGAPNIDLVGDSLAVVGFGSGEQRAGTVVLSEVDEHTLTYVPGPDMTCGGDSGGPVLTTIDGEMRLWGITSAGDRACEAWGVAAQIDDQVIELLAAEPEAPQWPVEPEAICEQGCVEDAECPGDLVCTDDGLCVVRGLEPGNLAGPCTSPDDCASGQCVTMGASAQCLEPCAVEGEDETVGAPAGCTIGRERGGGFPLALVLTVLGWGLCRRSSAAQAAATQPSRSVSQASISAYRSGRAESDPGA